MTREEFQNKMNSIGEKLGPENTSLIADEIGLLITDNDNMNKDLETRDTNISKLQKEKENLISVNGNLLQQVGMGQETKPNKEDKKDPKSFNFNKCFDEKGNFIN